MAKVDMQRKANPPMVYAYGSVEEGRSREGHAPLAGVDRRRTLAAVAGGICLLAAAAVLVSAGRAGRTELESAAATNAEIRALRALRQSDKLLHLVDKSRMHRAQEALVMAQAKRHPVRAPATSAASIKAEARRVERQALRGRTRHFSGLSAEEGEPKLGPLASSKWVPEDHPEGHKECPLAPEDCDEIWPWAKQRVKETGPAKRHSILGDNLVGLGSDDDVVVSTPESGLIPQAEPYVDKFDNWPEESAKNKDLLYGSARKMISNKYLGVGDQYVPIGDLEQAYKTKAFHRQPVADLMYGSWQMGFAKPATTTVRPDVNMFDQPYRQHMHAARGEGHQVFHVPNDTTNPLGPTLGDDTE
jgi:hypothetical protein